jgi:hypothetical protein
LSWFKLFSAHINSLFLSRVQEGCMQLDWGSSLWERGRGSAACSWSNFGEEQGSCSLSLPPLHLYPLKWGGVFGVGLKVLLSLFWLFQDWFPPF